MIEASSLEFLSSYPRNEISQLCVEIYLAQNSIVSKSTKIKDRSDLINWLNTINRQSSSRCTNLDVLLRSLEANLSGESLRVEITRWLNQNLPS